MQYSSDSEVLIVGCGSNTALRRRSTGVVTIVIYTLLVVIRLLFTTRQYFSLYYTPLNAFIGAPGTGNSKQ